MISELYNSFTINSKSCLYICTTGILCTYYTTYQIIHKKIGLKTFPVNAVLFKLNTANAHYQITSKYSILNHFIKTTLFLLYQILENYSFINMMKNINIKFCFY